MRRGRSRAVRLARGTLWGLAAAHVLEAAVLRHQRRLIADLPDPEDAGPDGPDGPVVLTAGPPPDDATRAGAAALLAGDVEMVDLVPGDLDPDRLLRVLRRVDLRRLTGDVLYTPGGASEAVALSPAVAARSGLAPAAGVDRGDLVRHTVEAQRGAPTARAVAVAPALAATPWTARERWRELQELVAFSRPVADLAPAAVALETVHLVALTAGVVVAPGPGLAALGTWCAQPLLALARTRSPGSLVAAGATRLARRGVGNVRTWAVWGASRRPRPTGGPTAPPPPAERFEEPATACPWCGSGAIGARMDASDLNQFKPGEFHLDECTDCGHVFQNPRLTAKGLDYYYADVYDDYGEEMLEFGLSTPGKGRIYRDRVEAVAAAWAGAGKGNGDGHGEGDGPASWLDVGTGHGHFCLVARQRWPEATFAGLDQSDSVVAAERRGRIDEAYRGSFAEVAGSLAGRFDVVSMNHYLEHTADPRREITAAAQAVRPGGLLLVELPDAESPWSRWLGRYWICWLQPQHLHFPPCGNLVAAIEAAGFAVVSIQRGEAGEGFDLTSAASLLAQHLAGPGALPWLPAPSPVARLRRLAVLVAAAPVLGLAALVDGVKDVGTRRPGSTAPGTAYRIVARRTGGGPPASP
jgi:SAM-dependent methyltransferase